MRIGLTNRKGFRKILELDKQSATKRPVNTGNAAKIDYRAAVDTPELIRVQLFG